jgi:hypothetical protein
MTIGTALVIIAILYFVDKHHLWKKAAFICLVIIAVVMVGLGGYYGWERLQERSAAKAEREMASQSVKDKQIGLSAGLVPNWYIPPPPKGFIVEDVAYTILNPVEANDAARTDGWVWYRDSFCGVLGAPRQPANRIIHGHELFDFESYDDRWLAGTNLPLEVKHALWSAKVAECRLPDGSRDVKACLDRERGIITGLYFPDSGGVCPTKQELVYLNNKRKDEHQ